MSARASKRARSSDSGSLIERSPTPSGYLDQAYATYVMSTAGSIKILNRVTQGVGVTNRVGKRIALQSLQIRGSVVGGTTMSKCEAAFMIVYDRKPPWPPTTPAITEILTSIATYAFSNDDNTGRFRILKRNDYVLLAGTTKEVYSVNEYLNLKALSTVFKGDLVYPEYGALYAVFVGDQGGTQGADARLAFRLRFTDV